MKLFFSNVNFDASESDLAELLRGHGFEPADVKLIKDRDTQRPRGFGFVNFDSSAEGQRAIRELDGIEFLGRKLNVQEGRADPRTEGRGDRGSRDAKARAARW